MNKRKFLSYLGLGSLGLVGGFRPVLASGSKHDVTAARRLGQELATTLPEDALCALRHISRNGARPGHRDLAATIAADHRADRIVRLHGIRLSQTEAALCLAIAEGQTA